MHNEGQPNQDESREDIAVLFEQEIRQALSPVWAKSTQELLPGYLPNKPRGEYSKEDLARYKIAYGLLGDMVKAGEVEVLFMEEAATPIPDSPLEDEIIAIPRFKLVTSGGKKSTSTAPAIQAGLVANT